MSERFIPGGRPSVGFAARMADIPCAIRPAVIEYLDETHHLLGYEEPCDLFGCDGWPAIIEDLMDSIRYYESKGRAGLDLTLVGGDFGRYLDAMD